MAPASSTFQQGLVPALDKSGNPYVYHIYGEIGRLVTHLTYLSKTMSDHNKESLQFWVTCPECGHKFGVNVDTVLKYVDRVFDELTENLEEAGKDFTDEDEEEGA